MSQITSNYLKLFCTVLALSVTNASEHFEDEYFKDDPQILNHVRPKVASPKNCSFIVFEAGISILSNKILDSVIQSNLVTQPITKFIYMDCKAVQYPLPSAVFQLPSPIDATPGDGNIKEFSVPVKLQNTTGTLYFNIQFNVRTNKYGIRGGRAHIDDSVDSFQALQSEKNSSTIWVDTGKSSNCEEYSLKSDPSRNFSLEVTLISLKYEFFNRKFFIFNWKYIQNIDFSKTSENICPAPPLPEVTTPVIISLPCYIIKFDAKSKATVLTRDNKTEDFIGNSTSLTLSNCTKPSSSISELKPMVVSPNMFSLPIVFNGLSATAYMQLAFNHTTGNYSFRRLTIGNFSSNRWYNLYPLNRNNLTVFPNQTGSCKNFQLQTKIMSSFAPFTQLTVSFEDLKLQIFQTNTLDPIVVSNNLSELQFSNETLNICYLPTLGVTETQTPQTCYVIKLAAKSTANFVTATGVNRHFSEKSKLYTFSNCTEGPYSLTFDTLKNSTIFHLRVGFNASQFSTKNPSILIDLNFNHNNEEYSIDKIVGQKFDQRNKTFDLLPQNPSSNKTVVFLNQTGICDSYRWQSKPESNSSRKLTVTLENLKFEIFHATVKNFNVVANNGFSKQNVTICSKDKGGKSGVTSVASNIGVVLGIAFSMIASK